MLGRPASCEPVWKNVIAGSWLIASVCIDLTKHRSSTIFAVCGSSSLTHAPRLAVLRELEDRAGQRQRRLVGRHAGEPLAHADARRAGPGRSAR